MKGIKGAKKTPNDMIDGEAVVTADGVVLASFKQVDGFTEFDKTDNSGYFFPFTIGKEFADKKPYKVQRILPEPGKVTESSDDDWVFKVDKTKVFEIKGNDGSHLLTLDFRYATYPE